MNTSKTEQIDFYSAALSKQMSLTVYLPRDYDGSTPLPALYFFHGRSGNENIIYAIDMPGTADKLIEAGLMRPMIIACPRIENSRGINSSAECREAPDAEAPGVMVNLGMYEDYFIKEVIPLIESRYNTVKERSGRFIGGVSGGGYTALHNALRHQDMFLKAGGHMPAMEIELTEEDKPFYKDAAMWQKYDPVSLAKSNGILPDMQFYLDAGDMDEGGFYKGAALLHEELRKKGIASQNHVFPGHHNIEYVKSNLEKYLMFYGGL